MLKKRSIRKYVQMLSFVLYNPFGFTFKYCPVPALNCYACPWALGACPIGSLQHFMVIKKIPFLLIGFFTLIGSTVGRLICGWACPIGWLQEMLYKIPTPKIKINCTQLRFFKYIVLLVLVLFIPYISGEPWFSKLCFVGTLEGGVPLAVTDKSIRQVIGPFFYGKLALTVVFLFSFIFSKRFFCRFVCPLGAIYSLFNRYSFLKLNVGDGCTKCGRCQDICPMDLKVYEEPNSPECIRCFECTACPHVNIQVGKNVMEFSPRRKKLHEVLPQ